MNNSLAHISVVLVRTIYPSNIGSVARAMANMGINRLILVDRKCEVNSKARQGAACAQDHLSQRIEYASWDEFYANENEGIRIALTTRKGKRRQITELGPTLENIKNTPSNWQKGKTPVYLFFGPEDHGLSDEDLKFVHTSCYIPTYSELSSLNISQAVMVTLYEARRTWGLLIPGRTELSAAADNDDGDKQEFFFPEKALREWLECVGFDLSREVNAYEKMKRLFLSRIPTYQELNVLERIIFQNIRKLKERATPPVEVPRKWEDDPKMSRR